MEGLTVKRFHLKNRASLTFENGYPIISQYKFASGDNFHNMDGLTSMRLHMIFSMMREFSRPLLGGNYGSSLVERFCTSIKRRAAIEAS